MGKRKIPRVVLLALALVLVLAFAGGCSSGSDETSDGSGSGGGESSSSIDEAVGGDDSADGGGSGDGGESSSSLDEAADGRGAAASGETALTADAVEIDSGGALTFNASEVTESATFIPLIVDGVYMEVVAVRAPDDTVRTAFNTCQVCWDSGRGYYIQEADELVCQNCGNRFNVSDVEVVHGGCNPVPITEEYKAVDGDSVAIGYDILREAAPLFADWKS
ncbi:MAG: DUF2318 domain-containing protein [Clostridiales Family XIII bacterium]|nr:DUF2318 domain-containing protein [Clostridiales Family XIII bacterium]